VESSDYLIVGGVAAGPKSAATLARRLPDARITLMQKEEHLSFARCGLPYFASGDVNRLDELMETAYGVTRDAHFFRSTKGFEALTGIEVTSIDRGARVITARRLATGETFEHGYDTLILATGATPNAPPFPIPNCDTVGLFQGLGDAQNFRQRAEQGKISRAVIVGAGPVGCELAEAVGGIWGIEGVLIECAETVLPGLLDPEMSALVKRELVGQGIEVLTGQAVESVALMAEGKPVVSVAGGGQVSSDYVFCALGVHPEAELARRAGLDIGTTGGIMVNTRMQTSDPHIYAGGDCVELRHRITGRPMRMPMGSLANRHGRVIAENLAGYDMEFAGSFGALVLKVFDLNVGKVGLSETEAQQAGYTVGTVWGSFNDKPDYYPEAKSFALKLVYAAGDKKLLGLQAVGNGDIVRRIDVFSSYLRCAGTVADLLDLEHGYAPPYAEALDPLHHMAAIAQAQERGVDSVPPQGHSWGPASAGLLILDVREAGEVETRPVPAAFAQAPGQVVWIPLGELASRRSEVPSDRPVIVICQRGLRSYQAALKLKATGQAQVSYLAGGLEMHCE
jgi:NADPH-dependent 2,4-dienoyl-CoA reductase/sulfur reductase-like enzyme/rhodanese-related sulfurtransferase